MKHFIFCVVFALSLVCLAEPFAYAQVQYPDAAENWSEMAHVDYELGEDEYGDIYIPVFSDGVVKMSGRVIALSGFIIPFDGMFSPDHIILSKLPVASCFFCGGAGPETVAEIFLSEPMEYTDHRITVVGRLELNANSDDQLMYILKSATLQE